MPLVLPSSKNSEFELCPQGSHLAVCYRVIDLGTQRTEYKGEVGHKHQILIQWELPEEKMADGRPFSIGKKYTYSAHSKSALRQDLESWRGKPFTEAELGAFDIGRLLGIGCMLGVAHRETERGTFANVTAILKLPKTVDAPRPSNTPVCFSLADRPFSNAVFGMLSERLQEIVKRSPEYQAAVEGRDPSEQPPPPNGEGDYGSDPSDPIPF